MMIDFSKSIEELNSYKGSEKKIDYMSYIKGAKNEECNKAINRIFEKINIETINNLIDEIPCITLKRKEFYKKIIYYRYEIIKSVYIELDKA